MGSLFLRKNKRQIYLKHIPNRSRMYNIDFKLFKGTHKYALKCKTFQIIFSTIHKKPGVNEACSTGIRIKQPQIKAFTDSCHDNHF